MGKGWAFVSPCAAALLAVAPLGSARAEDARVDFDRKGGEVSEVVRRAASAVERSQGPEMEGSRVPGAVDAVNEGEVSRRIVVFKKGGTSAFRMNAVKALGAVPTKDLRLIDAVAVVLPRTRAAAFDSGIPNNPDILRVDEDIVQDWLNGAAKDDEKEQRTPWGVDRVRAREAWGASRGSGVKVAVVDTGIDTRHPDLKVKGGYNAIDREKPFDDDHGHGTHVAGTIAAQDNAEGVVGIAPDVELYGVKVIGPSGRGPTSDIIAGIQWAAEQKMDVANLSLGGPSAVESLHEAVKKAVEAGVSVIAASGNSGGSVHFPGAYPEAIAVAASGSDDSVAAFSSRGPEVDFIAPGVDVESTFKGGGYRKLSGTSMATPHVTALAALAAGQGARGPEAVRQALKRAARKLPDAPAEQQGEGMIDAGLLGRRQLTAR